MSKIEEAAAARSKVRTLALALRRSLTKDQLAELHDALTTSQVKASSVPVGVLADATVTAYSMLAKGESDDETGTE